MNTRSKLTTVSLLSLSLLAGASVAGAQYYQGPPPERHFGNGWEAPPPEFAAVEQRGYRDGVDGARKDFENHRQPTVMNRDEYRNPHFIRPFERRDYLMGFRRGYDAAVHQIYGPRFR
ncbi:MAG: hypothetical protein V4555_12270 [Acidobacteriota bacterium]